MLTRLKSVLATVLVLLVVFSSVTYTACNKKKYTYIDPCEGIECKNNGICISGECDCTTGYTGTYCDKKAITPYLGNWAFSQQLKTSNNQVVSGPVKNYEVAITENSKGVTYLSFDGLMGEGAFMPDVRIAMQIGEITYGADSIIVETDIPSSQNNFVFLRNQPLGSSVIQLIKGEGYINSTGTQISGEFWVSYPDSVKGAVQDKYSFTASYIN